LAIENWVAARWLSYRGGRRLGNRGSRSEVVLGICHGWGGFWFNVGSLVLRRQGYGGQRRCIGYYRLLSVTIGYLSVTVGYRRLLWVTYRLLKSDRTVTGGRVDF
jgi:hypothetical protein